MLEGSVATDRQVGAYGMLAVGQGRLILGECDLHLEIAEGYGIGTLAPKVGAVVASRSSQELAMLQAPKVPNLPWLLV